MKRNIFFGIVGGLIGFGIHLILHRAADIELFVFGPHIIQGATFSIIGILLGVLVAKRFSSK